jgi:hypothetical protein
MFPLLSRSFGALARGSSCDRRSYSRKMLFRAHSWTISSGQMLA